MDPADLIGDRCAGRRPRARPHLSTSSPGNCGRHAMIARWSGWIFAASVLGVVAFFAVTAYFSEFLSPESPVPIIEYPARLDLGDREMGDEVIKPYTIVNRGRGELVITHIRTACSCTGMERAENGRYVKVELLRLKPGEKADLVMRIAVRGPRIGGEMINVIEFQTNDPKQPSCRIEAIVRRVSGGVYLSPES